MVMAAVNVVAFVTVTELTVIPAPKLTWDAPCEKFVAEPTIRTLRLCPCLPLFGSISVRAEPGVPTVTAAPSVDCSTPVVTVKVREPGAASEAAVTTAVMEVAEFTVTEPIVMP
jgi:hypothetical protein